MLPRTFPPFLPGILGGILLSLPHTAPAQLRAVPITAPVAEAGLPRPAVALPEGWVFRPTLSDEFGGRQLDRAKWRSDVASWGTWSWNPDMVRLENGRLFLSMDYLPHQRAGKTLYYQSGIVRSEAEVTYGYFEARIRGCDRFPGVSPAFWLYSLGDRPGRVRYSEIDVVELQQDAGPVKKPAVMDFNLHARIQEKDGSVVEVGPGKNPDLCRHQWRASFDPRKGDHLYSALVTPARIVWYVDGREVASEDNRFWHLPMRVVLSLGLRSPFVDEGEGGKVANAKRSTPRGFPTRMEVDYVRVWTPPGGSVPKQKR